ncbi:carnitine O-palmitoyltransferase 2, mitochondrial isoform X1 [Hetaerina americana]|uniref:carnitine O-palmitoyltransferase 2, mitochondrial isoform X1 n=2 Tax=Hetaerina americana TaxID=62018 RepID=UPI003A7F2936
MIRFGSFNKYKAATAYTTLRFKSSSFQDDYQYLQQSKVPTMHFQPSLPRLPIPELSKTAERYLNAQKPLLSTSDFSKTEEIVKSFVGPNGAGQGLHKQLVDHDKKNKHTSYISKPWFDMYLSDRIPLPINYNPILVYIRDPNEAYNKQVIRATNMLISSVRFMKSLRAEILEPEVYHLNPKKSNTDLFRTVTGLLPSMVSWYGAYLFKAFPLDMSQFPSLFNANRIPEIGKDVLFQDTSAKHVLVLRKGEFYIFDVLDSEGNIFPPEVILANLKKVISMSDGQPPSPDHPVGILTTMERDSWAKARKHLKAISPQNETALKLVDSALFALILDDESCSGHVPLVQNFLHGDGTNRWFDKSFSLIIDKDGEAAINFEHSWGDGVAVLRYFNDIYKDSTTKPRVHPDTETKDNPEVTQLDFLLDQEMKNVIAEAKSQYESVTNHLKIDIMEFPGFGKNVCKKQKVSPDAVMQLGFQVAFHKQTGKQVATYESCSTSAFRHGRTETIRPCTMATKAFCESINSNNQPSISELQGMIKKCSEVHGALTRDAAMGQGFDRHLFGLRKLAEVHPEFSKELPEIYRDPAYSAINHNVLSTSTLSSPYVQAGAFGPVVKDGYGIGYLIADNMLGTIVTSYPPHRDGADFVNCLRKSFEDIYRVLVK